MTIQHETMLNILETLNIMVIQLS